MIMQKNNKAIKRNEGGDWPVVQTSRRNTQRQGADKALELEIYTPLNKRIPTRPFEISGISLHDGTITRVRIERAICGSGITFIRLDLGGIAIKADAQSLGEAALQTVLSNGGAQIRTPEHLLGALFLEGVEDATIIVDRREIPILDGSAKEWVHAIRKAGCISGGKRRLVDGMGYGESEGGGFVSLKPASPEKQYPYTVRRDERLDGDVRISFRDKAIGDDRLVFSLVYDDALSAIDPTGRDAVANAKTFVQESDLTALRAAGLVKGGSMKCAVVVSGERILNPEDLTHPHGFVLHKALDILGDLSLCGGGATGSLLAEKPGHTATARLVRDIDRYSKAKAA